MHRNIFGICLAASILAISSNAVAQFKAEDFERADKATVRLNPDDFHDLPSYVRTALERRGCTIPQPFNAGNVKKNVIKGRFQSRRETDWAVLCSHKRRSSILVFHGGSSGQIDEFAEMPDADYLQVVSGGRQIGYSRQLAVATPSAIRRHLARVRKTMRNIDHDGIENIFVEKGSMIWLRVDGNWKQLTRAD